MSARDELLKVMLDADEAHGPEGSMWPELADAILAAGYVKESCCCEGTQP